MDSDVDTLEDDNQIFKTPAQLHVREKVNTIETPQSSVNYGSSKVLGLADAFSARNSLLLLRKGVLGAVGCGFR